MNHISTVRQHLLDQMAALRTAKPGEIKAELDRAKGLSELAQVCVNVARVEVDYLQVTNQDKSPFFDEKPHLIEDSKATGGQVNHFPGVMRHQIR